MVQRVRYRWQRTSEGFGEWGLFPIGVLMLIAAVERFDDAAFGVLAPEIRHAFHLSDSRYVLIATLTSVMPLLLAAPMGYLGDRGHRVRLSQLGALVWTVTAIGTGLAPVVWLLIVARLGGGAGLLVNEPTHASLLADYYPPETLGSAFGLYRVGSTGLGLVGAPLAGLIATVAGWRTTFIVLAIPTVVMVAIAGRLREPERGSSFGATVMPDEALPSIGEGYRRVRAILSLRRTWVAAFFFGGATIPFDNYLNLYLDEVFHFSPTARGIVTGVFGVGTIVGLALGGALAQRVMRREHSHALPLVMSLMGFEFAAGIVLMALAPSAPLAITAVVVLSVGASGYLPAYQTLVSLISPPRLRAQAFAWSLLWYGLGAIIIGTFVGAISGTHGQRVGLVVLAGLVALAAAVELTCGHFVARDAAQAVTLEETASTDAFVACRRLDVAYGGCQVLFGVDLDIKVGELVALLGTNGAGKSTLLKAISGLVDPVGGAVFFDGRDITHADGRVTAQLGIAHVPGGRGVFPSLTVEENLRVAGWLPGDSGVAEVLARFPILQRRWHEAAGDLSGGEQQMLSLAQCMLARPKLLLVDELSLGLSPLVVEQLLDVVRDINAAGTTVIIVEQSVTTSLRLATRAVFMEKGEVRFDGPAAELAARPDLLRAVFLERPTTAKRRRTRRVNGTAERPLALAARNLTKRYGGVTALDDVDLELHAGEILGVIGPNGAGKTTLFDLLSGFAPPDAGVVMLSGTDVTRWTATARAAAGLGRSFQDGRLFPSLTVREALAVAYERSNPERGVLPAALWLPQVADAEKVVRAEVDAVVERLGLAAFADKFVNELSTGSRRVVELGLMLLHRPSVIILDEPSAGIAQRETEALGPMLRAVREELDASIVVIEHDMGLISDLADTLLALDRGRVIAVGTPKRVLAHPAVVAAYLGGAGVSAGAGLRGAKRLGRPSSTG